MPEEHRAAARELALRDAPLFFECTEDTLTDPGGGAPAADGPINLEAHAVVTSPVALFKAAMEQYETHARRGPAVFTYKSPDGALIQYDPLEIFTRGPRFAALRRYVLAANAHAFSTADVERVNSTLSDIMTRRRASLKGTVRCTRGRAPSAA